MMLQVLAPSVEDGEKADLSSEMLGVGGDPTKGLGGGLKEEAVDHPGVLQGDRVERRGESEDDMEVFDGEQLGLACLHPVGGSGGLALGAVAVAARVVGDLLMPAPVTRLDVPAQRGGPTGGDVAKHAALPRRERAVVPLEKGVAVSSQDVGHFEPGSVHGCGRPSADGPRRSSGLCVACSTAVETWV